MTLEAMPEACDWVVVGAGSAGCVLANRLSAFPAARVLLLEAGGSDHHPHVLAPTGFLHTFRNPRFNWFSETEPGLGVGGRAIFFPRARRSAAPLPSTARSGCATRRATSTPGRSAATSAGPGPTCCRPSAPSRTTPAPPRWTRGCGCAAMACLRVADASVMPTMVSANTNAATMMIAERAAGMVLAGRRAPAAAA